MSSKSHSRFPSFIDLYVKLTYYVASEEYMQFKARKSIVGVRKFHIIFAAFIVFSVWVYFFADKTFGIVMAGISAALLLVILFETGRFGWHYSVDEDGIRVTRTFKTYFISADKIQTVKEISWSKVKEVIAQVQRGETMPSKSDAAKGGVRTQIAVGRLIGYSSVPISLSDSASGKSGKYRKSGNPNGKKRGKEAKFILLVRKDGNRYLLTPEKTKEFLYYCKKKNFIDS